MRSVLSSFVVFFLFVLLAIACGGTSPVEIVDPLGPGSSGGADRPANDGAAPTSDGGPPSPDPSACAGTWTTDGVDTTPRAWDVGGGVAVVDATGGLHLAYGGTGPVRYASRPAPGGPWTTTTLPEGGWNVALAVDAKGGVHVSYAKQEAGAATQIRYASRSPGASTWSLATVDTVGDEVQDTTAIGVDGEGGVHVRYLGPGEPGTLRGDLRYAYRPLGGSFTTTIVAPTAVSPGSVAVGGRSLAVDAAGGVHVAFFPSHSTVAYASKAKNGGWTIAEVDSAASNLAPASVVVDAKNAVHLGYLGSTSRSVRRAFKPAGGSWTTSAVDTSTAQIFAPTLAVDDTQAIHVAYRLDGSLRYLHIPGPNATSFDFFNYVDTTNEEPRIAVDRQGGVHIAYRDEPGKRVKVAYRCPGACPKKSCAAMGATCGTKHDGCNVVSCGSCSDPSLCGAGGVANQCCVPKTCAAIGAQCGVASDGCGKSISCGTCNGPLECGTAAPNQCGACVSGHWMTGTIQSLGDVGRASAITVAGTTTHVVFADDTNDDLIYASHLAGAGWTTSLVDTSASKVWGSAVRVDASGRVHVLYAVRASNVLQIRYATRAAGVATWTKSVVASHGTYLSTNVAMALDGAGTLHAAWYDGQTSSVVHGSKTPLGAWTMESISAGGTESTPGTYGELVGLAVDGAGGVHVVHSRTVLGADAVVHVFRAAGAVAWSSEIVAQGSTVHKEASIAIDALGIVHVTYATSSSLMYAKRNPDGSFSSGFIDNGSYVESALAIDASGKLHVAYYDDAASVRVLRYATPSASGFWTRTNADTQKASCRGPAIAIDASGGIHVSHWDGTSGDMKYSYRCP